MARGEEKPAMNLFRLLGLGFGLIAATANARAETIAVSATKSLASAAIFVADDRGFFRDEGITLDFKYFNAAQPVAVAVASGDAQFGITGLSAGFYNMAGKQSLKIVAAGAREEPGHSTGAYVVSEQAYEKGIKSVKDLKGARFGLTTVGSPYHYSLLLAAQKYGFDIAGVKLVPLQTFGNVLAAIKGHQIDAGLLNTYVALPAANSGDVKIIGWVGDETPWQLGALFTSAEISAKHRDLVERFVRAYKKGAALYHDAIFAESSPEASQKDAIIQTLCKYSGLTPDEVRQSLNFIDRKVVLDVDDINHQIETWKQQNKVGADVTANAIMDTEFVSARP
jgi:NitT/TauT family transport system substrate-binding protein